MRIGQKLILGFVSVALLVGVVGYISVNTSQKALQKSIGESSVSLAVEILDKINRNVYNKIERFESFRAPLLPETIVKSNQEFQKLDNIQSYINEKDREWTFVPKEEITPFMKGLINNKLSKELRKRIKFYEEKYGFSVFPEVFVTNKYGANVGQTGKTNDYYQADEKWWQGAKKDGLYVGAVEYDRSAGVYSADVGIRIDDEAGNFLGVIKVVLNIEEVINILKEAETFAEYKTTQFKLLTKDGKLIYSTEDFEFLEDVSDKLLSRFEAEEHLGYFVSEGDKPGEWDGLFAHAHSKGYKDFKGLGWILIIDYETEEIFAPVAQLRNRILIISLAVTTLAVVIGLFISGTISRPIAGLSTALIEMGKGRLDTRIEVTSKDEIGTLAQSFNQMTEDFKKSTTSIDKLNKEIAERQRAEKELERANEQLEASVERANLMAQEAGIANVAKSQFLANVSHEIRTPMNAIIGFSEVLAEENLTDEQLHHVDIIRESAEHLLKLINDILDFSKIEAGKLDTEIIECSLEQLFAAIESLMRPAAKQKGLAFEILQCGKLPARIRTDPVRLRQCLVNLINNAIKYTEKGHVYVNVSLQQIDDKGTPFCNKSQNGNPKPFIRFDVEDTGIGIPDDKQESVFQDFTQADGGSTRRYDGAGLGLPITKKLARLLGGRLTLMTSEVGKGSVFSLAIPAGVDVEAQPLFSKYDFVNELKQEPDTAGIPEHAKFSGRVLVVEDSRNSRMLVKLLLERLGLQVTIAEDGKEAVDKALSKPFDLIFMDIQMPNMDGYEATRILRRKGLKTAIVALTACAMKGDDEKCVSAGCSDYVSKPIDRRILFEVIRKYLPLEREDLSEKIDSVRSEVEELSQ